MPEIRTEWDGKKQYLEIELSEREEDKVMDVMEDLGLTVKDTELGLGFGQELSYFKDKKNAFYNICKARCR